MAKKVIEYVNQDSTKGDKLNTRWWSEPEETVFSHLFRTVTILESRQSYRTMENIKHARLYSDLEVLGVYAGLYSPSLKDATLPNRLSLNVVKSCVDTITSKICKSKPRPMFLTEGGDWPLRKKAQDLTKFIDGQFDAMKHYEVKQDTSKDSYIFGTGAAKFYIDQDAMRIVSERVVIEEILVDDAEAIYGKPRTLYQRRLVNKQVLIEQFPEFASEIEGASNSLTSEFGFSDNAKDLVKVVEAWHLKSGANAKDGVHAMVIENCTLLKEPYKYDWFPFTFERWNKSLVGFFGVGIARELTGIQIEINKILRSIQQSMHLFAVPRVYIDNASQINLSAINNDIGAIIKHSDSKPPTFYTPQAMSPDVYNHLWNLVQKAYEFVGVSQLSAQSAKPAGLDSGRALREFTDIESERFQIVGQRREDSFLQDAKIVVALAKELSELEPKFKVKVSNNGSMKTIKFKDVDMDEDKYILRCFPASILPTQPAAKMQTIVEYTQAGFFDKETAQDLMDFPDIQAATNMQIAPRRVVLKTLDKMVEDGIYVSPEPYMNIQLALQLSQYYYMNAKLEGVPEEKLELIRRYMDNCTTILTAAQAPPPVAMPPSQMMPPEEGALPAAPEAPPTNPMLPIA